MTEDHEDQTENKYAGGNYSDVADEIIDPGIPGSDEIGPGKQLYKCEECEASYKTKMGLYFHTRSKHKGICYSCKYCGDTYYPTIRHPTADS